MFHIEMKFNTDDLKLKSPYSDMSDEEFSKLFSATLHQLITDAALQQKQSKSKG